MILRLLGDIFLMLHCTLDWAYDNMFYIKIACLFVIRIGIDLPYDFKRICSIKHVLIPIKKPKILKQKSFKKSKHNNNSSYNAF